MTIKAVKLILSEVHEITIAQIRIKHQPLRSIATARPPVQPFFFVSFGYVSCDIMRGFIVLFPRDLFLNNFTGCTRLGY